MAHNKYIDRQKLLKCLEDNNWNYSVVAMKMNIRVASLFIFIKKHNFFIEKNDVYNSSLWRLNMLINNPNDKIALEAIKVFNEHYNKQTDNSTDNSDDVKIEL